MTDDYRDVFDPLRRPYEVYFIAAPEVARFKIGVSSQTTLRLESLQIGSPVRLECVATMDAGDGLANANIVEQQAWKAAEALGYARLHGEWFSGALSVEATHEIIAATEATAPDVLRMIREDAVAAAAEKIIEDNARGRAVDAACKKMAADRQARFPQYS